MKPEELDEWETYISQLAGLELQVQTDTANSQTFISMMAEEGRDVAWCRQILMLFVRQCKAVGCRLPAGGMYNLDIIASMDEIASMGVQMSEEEADALASSYTPIDDGLEQALLRN